MNILDTFKHAWNNSKSKYYEEKGRDLEKALGPLNIVQEERTGYEYDEYEVIYHLQDSDKYISVKGYYSSWDGVNFDHAKFQEVEPIQKTITIYNPVKKQ